MSKFISELSAATDRLGCSNITFEYLAKLAYKMNPEIPEKDHLDGIKKKYLETLKPEPPKLRDRFGNNFDFNRKHGPSTWDNLMIVLAAMGVVTSLFVIFT